MAAGAHTIDPFGARHLTVGPRHFGARLQKRAARGEVREHARIVGVLPASAVAGLAADPDLDEVARREPRAQLVNAVLERLGGRRPGSRHRSANRRHLGVDRLDQRAVARDVEPKPAVRRQQLVDHLPLVGGRAAPGSALFIDRAPDIIEVGDGVVAEDAGLIPDAAGMQPRPLRHQHRITLEAEALGLEDVRDRKEQLALGVGRTDLDASEVLSVATADDARDAVEVTAAARRGQLDEARALLFAEAGAVVLEAKCRSVEGRPDVRPLRQARHEVHRPALPGRGDLGVTAGATRRAGIVDPQNVAAHPGRPGNRRRPCRDGAAGRPRSTATGRPCRHGQGGAEDSRDDDRSGGARRHEPRLYAKLYVAASGATPYAL